MESPGEDEEGDAITAALVSELAPGAVLAAENQTASERARRVRDRYHA